MTKLTKPKYMKILDIQKVLKYIFIDEKRPRYIQLNPKPKSVAIVYVSQNVDISSLKVEQGDSSTGTILVKKDLRLPRKDSIKNDSSIYSTSGWENKESGVDPNQLSSFEVFLKNQGYLRVHLNEGISPKDLFKNILKSVDVKDSTLSVITPENLILIEKHNILHMFSYSKFIKSQANFDSSIFDSYSKPKIPSPYFLIAIDCEMMQCENETQVGRVSMLDHTGRIIYDKFIRPKAKVTNYLEQYSGLNEDNTSGGIALEKLNEDLLSIIGTNTYLLGHGLENDLEALCFYTDKVIDTSYLFLNSDGYKIKLSQLSKIYLGDQIQNKSHCPTEDALCCLKLLAFKISQLRNFFDPSGAVLELGVNPKNIKKLEDTYKSEGLFFHEESDVDKLSNFVKHHPDLFIIFIYQIKDQKYIALKQKTQE
ncbi:uncharacterized protein VICG_00420 [Vittaforma corneae ATCC 50505]|uniref:Exonuclease domain-containing protein n=1 Tax=Vittaforma corneae (strain ATCC 50505) TaxID=993615 RepID=L2GP58_VITCO|nr:uncharacterized protein VICG_00420 [Vittaforma corneae ATCC 50505]ELA42668.1 hypothetical protein VICG_00420 [Vittaforma corneae ATCC 50505]